MIPLWQPGHQPSGLAQAILLRDIRGRIEETAEMGNGLFQPWSDLRAAAGGFFLTSQHPLVLRERSHLWGPGLAPAARLALARSLLATFAAFERKGIRPGPIRPEALVRGSGGFLLLDPLVEEWLLPFRPDWPLYPRVGFLAPELLHGAAPSLASDRFALGVTVYWLFAGRLPFADEDGRHIPTRILAQEPVDPRLYLPLLPAGAATCALALLRKSVTERPTAAELLPSLAAAVSSQADRRHWCGARNHLPAPHRPTRGHRIYLPLGLAAALFLGAMVLARSLWRPTRLPSLDEARLVVSRLYQCKNAGDYLSAQSLFAGSAQWPSPPASASAIWDTIRGVTVASGNRPDLARAVVSLEEAAFARGAIRRWAGREVIYLAVRGGKWKIVAITRDRSDPSGQSPG